MFPRQDPVLPSSTVCVTPGSVTFSALISSSPHYQGLGLPPGFVQEANHKVCLAAGGVRTTVSCRSVERWFAIVTACRVVSRVGPTQGRTTLGFFSEPPCPYFRLQEVPGRGRNTNRNPFSVTLQPALGCLRRLPPSPMSHCFVHSSTPARARPTAHFYNRQQNNYRINF